MNTGKDNKQSFMKNVSIILFAQFAVKILGMIYRIVITNVDGFGNEGSGYYSAGFNVYTLLLALSSVGIPNAISKMTSERIALEDERGAHKIFKTALILFSAIGLICTAAMFFGAGWIARYIIAMPGAKYVLMALSPSILFVCVSSVIRGYFNGMKNMTATAASQILEQIFKSLFTIGIVLIMAGLTFYPTDDFKAQMLAAGANLATSIATVLSFLYLLVFYMRRKNAITASINKSAAETIENSFTGVFKSILLVSIPISLGSIISAINRIVDTATITRGIRAAFANVIPAHDNAAAVISPSISALDKEAARLSGMLGKSDTLINLPVALNIAFATVLVPSIAGELAVGNKKAASSKVSFSLLISILIIFPCVVGYLVLGQPIYKLLYPSVPDGYKLLQLSAVSLIFIALNQTISGSLQGCGKIYAPATGLFIGCIAKFILNIILIRQPSINIYGAPISSIVCQAISFCYGFTVLRRNVPVSMKKTKYIIKPAACSIVMGAAAFFLYKALIYVLHSNTVSLLLTIAAAAVIYIALILGAKILNEDEIQQMPAGDKLIGILKKFRMI